MVVHTVRVNHEEVKNAPIHVSSLINQKKHPVIDQNTIDLITVFNINGSDKKLSTSHVSKVRSKYRNPIEKY